MKDFSVFLHYLCTTNLIRMSEIKNKVISVNYTLYRDTPEGEMIETTEGREPLQFMSGMGHMIPDFEMNVVSLNVGDEFSFSIKSENAYGTRRDEAVMDLPMNIFQHEGQLVEGVEKDKVVPLQDQSGRTIPAKVVSINDETVTVDVNHPLADQDLHFVGSVVETRVATAQEMDHGHVHSDGQDH
jgi:FKBP-type peptidyl-prolyl cis-trans isomerase SlyD